jgi:hypothetical protein
LGDAVKELLDVSASNERIKDMKRLFGTQLKTEARSRNDIDAVYVIANAQQTRLIKPFFDVNVSIFGERLPVFSSSRSYLVGETQAQMRDLNGLTFTEMPWLIKPIAKDTELTFNQIEENQTQLKKLFAFGNDAYNLIGMLRAMEIIDNYEVNGLTGTLSMNADNSIKRALLWSQYRQGKVIAIQ